MLIAKVRDGMLIIRPLGKATKVAESEAFTVLHQLLVELVGTDNVTTIQLPTLKGGVAQWFMVDPEYLDHDACHKLFDEYPKRLARAFTAHTKARIIRTGSALPVVRRRKKKAKKEKKEKVAAVK